jgi:hypothetical protein
VPKIVLSSSAAGASSVIDDVLSATLDLGDLPKRHSWELVQSAVDFQSRFATLADEARQLLRDSGAQRLQIARPHSWPAWVAVALALGGFDLPAQQREAWVRRQLLPGAWPATLDLLENKFGVRAGTDPRLVGDARHALADGVSGTGGFLGNARLRLARDEFDRSVLRTFGSEHAVYAVSQLAAVPMARWVSLTIAVDGVDLPVGAHIVGHSLWTPSLERAPHIVLSDNLRAMDTVGK